MPIFADDTTFDWSGLERSKISLEAAVSTCVESFYVENSRAEKGSCFLLKN